MILRLMTAALMTAAAVGVARADIVLGVAGPMSGPNAAYGEQYRVGVKAAVERINANGGVLGQKLTVSVGDDVSDPKQGVSIANKFVADGVHYVVGHYNSGVTIPASDIYAENGVLFVTPTATNPMVTERGLWDAFRACGRDDQQGAIAAKFVLERFKGKKVAIVDDKSTAGKGLADEMARAYNAGGGRPVLQEEINPGEKDYSPLVARIKQSGGELVYYGGQHTEAGLIVRQMHDQGVTTSEFGAIGGEGALGTLMTSFPDPATFAEAKDAVADLKARNVPTEAVTLYAYAATQILAEAIARAKADDPKAASDYLHSGASISTVLGTISYDAKGDIKQPGFVVFEWRKVDGKLTPVALK
ncbi:MAG: branched-chain amino acid ABC transporter substrate-binding protein [Mesorhizobium sp.]|nr:MAG: branched-chain amino acid ABC transporter substrate-binding protein [Mesorhizobium sp.]